MKRASRTDPEGKRRTPAVAATLVLILFALLVTVVVEARGDAEFWPVAVPGLLTGVGTLALAWATVAVLRGDQADRRAREERDRRAQPSRFHVGALELFETTSRWQEDLPEDEREVIDGVRLTITNGSDFPITHIVIMLGFDQEAGDNIRSGANGDDVQTIERLETQSSSSIEFSMRWLHGLLWEHPPWTEVTFVDAAGSRWARTRSGELEDVTGTDDFLSAYEWIPKQLPRAADSVTPWRRPTS